jgi:hypothetical protein
MRFEDLTVQQYIEISKLDKEPPIDEIDKLNIEVKKMAIITGKSIEDVELMDVRYVKEKISFLKNVPQSLPFKKRLRIGFKIYKPSVMLQEIQPNQLIDFYSLYKAEAPLNDLLAVIYKKGKYHAKDHADLSAKMLNQKIGNVLGAVFFSLDYYKKCEKLITEYLMKNQELLAQTMDEIQNDKEFQDFLNTGAGSIT